MTSALAVLERFGWPATGEAFALVADGRTWSPATMAETGAAQWEKDGVTVRTDVVEGADGSVEVHLEAEGLAWVDEVCLLDVELGREPGEVHNHRWYDHLDLQQSTVVFVRPVAGDGDRGVFACYRNPFATFEGAGRRLRTSYRPAMAVRGAVFRADPLVIGGFVREGVERRRELLPGRDLSDGREPMYGKGFGPVPAVLDAGEVRAVRAATSARLPWRSRRVRVTHWDWAENTYRLDVGTDWERAEPVFDRMAQVAAEIGCDLQLLSLNIDNGEKMGLGHEDGPCQPLYFLGRGVAVGRLLDEVEPEPEAVERVLGVVERHGLRPVAYSNPQGIWGKRPEWMSVQEADAVAGWSCMAVPELQDAVVAAYERFRGPHRMAGYSLDFIFWMPCHSTEHGHAPGADSRYAQWDGFRRITAAIGRDDDTWLEGLIGSQHLMPWGLTHLTHPHPVLGDNQPQWLPAWPDLSLHRVAGNFQRRTAWIMRNMAFTPSWKVPGMVSHQANRRHVPDVERGWDWDGARYSLLSAIASGPSVISMGFLPCWDADEWAGMRERDGAFFRQWIDWARANAEVLARLEDITGEPRPGLVDGTMALADDGRSGFVFLTNPDYTVLRAGAVPVGDGVALRELHPVPGRWWRPEAVDVEPKTVAVYEVVAAPAGAVDWGAARPAPEGVTSVVGPWVDAASGAPVEDLPALRGSIRLRLASPWTPGRALADVLAAQRPPIEPVGRMVDEPWADPSRLRLHVEVIDPQAASVSVRVDGEPVAVKGCYVGTFDWVKDENFAVMENNLMGWYVDLTDLLADPDAAHTVELDVDLRGDAVLRGVHVAHVHGH